MALTLAQIEGVAPDQASLKAASKLMKVAKWPVRSVDASGPLMWGECQGSGANPYRVIVDRNDLGYKCTCPSRKFPCKHALALMWMYADDASAFGEAAVPEWAAEWVGRRRKTASTAPSQPERATGKSISGAALPDADADAAPSPEDIAKREKAAAKRREATRAGVEPATHDLEIWIGDQLRAGLSTFLADATDRCRRIAARMVDAKATALAGRIDELPARLLNLPAEDRVDAAISELGKLVLLVRAWRANPDDPELHRAMIAAETREQIFAAPDAPEVTSVWEVVGDRVTTRRDGLISQATWLLNLGAGPGFALLLDFFPANANKRTSPFAHGEQFNATLRYYPARAPLRALIADRSPVTERVEAWPDHHAIQAQIAAHQDAAPWSLDTPLLLPAGRVMEAAGRCWWAGGEQALPLSTSPDPVARGTALTALAGVWNGFAFDALGATSDMGRIAFDA